MTTNKRKYRAVLYVTKKDHVTKFVMGISILIISVSTLFYAKNIESDLEQGYKKLAQQIRTDEEITNLNREYVDRVIRILESEDTAYFGSEEMFLLGVVISGCFIYGSANIYKGMKVATQEEEPNEKT